MSLIKKYLVKKKVCLVTFTYTLPVVGGAEKVNLVGDFNQWNHDSVPLIKGNGGRYSVSVELPFNTIHQFRYLIDGVEWENDEDADSYELSPYGSYNSVVFIDTK